MWIARGQVDHYLSKHHPDPAKRQRQRPLSYEWDNLRYADGEVNNRKRNRDAEILDPYEVRDGWFRLNNALELEVTTVCPKSMRPSATRSTVVISLVDTGTGSLFFRDGHSSRFRNPHTPDGFRVVASLFHAAGEAWMSCTVFPWRNSSLPK